MKSRNMALVIDILGLVLAFGLYKLFCGLILYNWPQSTIGRFLSWSPPSSLPERLVVAIEGWLNPVKKPNPTSRQDLNHSELNTPTQDRNPDNDLNPST
jgi:hypothetical protein